MDIITSSIGQFAILGVVASLIMEFIKTNIKNSLTKKLTIVAISIVVGGVYAFTVNTPAYNAILGVLGASSTVYAFFLKK
jgi:hypothetical protein